MKTRNEQERRQLLATGAVLASVGGAGIIIPLIVGVPEATGAVAFPVGFLVGLATGLGTVLTLFNLRRS
ncbi:MAG: hypothetical protein KJ749_14075 [Planctomycetes bacterium]|nr:hypothetical protein [Planctomycetota bacterium]